MKKTALIIMLTATATTLYGGPNQEVIYDAPRQNTIEATMEIVPGVGIGPFTIGMTAPELTRELGESDYKHQPDAGIDFAYWFYKNEGLSFYVRSGTVIGMASLSPRHAIPGGPQVGMDFDEAILRWEKTLGREIHGQLQEFDAKSFFSVEDISVLIEVAEDNTIIEIGLEEQQLVQADVSELVWDEYSLEDHLARLSGIALDLEEYRVSRRSEHEGIYTTYYRIGGGSSSAPEADISRYVDRLWADMPDVDEILSLVGEPQEIAIAGDGPESHLNFFYGGVHLYFGSSNTLAEVRLGDDTSYRVKGVGSGSTVDEITRALGEPIEIVRGPIEWKDRVLYLPEDGGGYIKYKDEGVRFFLENDGRTAGVMYLFEPEK